MFFVVYAKMVDDKYDGIKLAGVYLGGAGTTQEEAENIARECVNTIKGGTIIPKIIYSKDQHKLIQSMLEIQKKFKKLEEQMLSAQDIIDRNTKKR